MNESKAVKLQYWGIATSLRVLELPGRERAGPGGATDLSYTYDDDGLRTLDVPFLSPGDTDHLLRYTDEDQPDPAGGMHFNLHNNLWGTAFPQWYGDDGAARFRIYVS